MRGRVGAAVAIFGVLLVAGCQEPPSQAPDSVAWPPGAAGVACNYLEYDRVAQVLGTRFDTAGGATKDDTYTCALTQSGREFPDLTLSITPTTVSDVIFQATVAPSGSTTVKGVGKVAYRVVRAATSKRGPRLELGWLSVRGRLMIVRYTFPADTPGGEADALAPRLVELAKAIETTITTPSG